MGKIALEYLSHEIWAVGLLIAIGLVIVSSGIALMSKSLMIS